MIKKKTLFKNISIFLCLVPMLLLSLFCLVPNHIIDDVCGADETVAIYSFHSSQLYNIERMIYHYNADDYRTCVFSSDVTFNTYTNELSVQPIFQYVNTTVSTNISYTSCIFSTSNNSTSGVLTLPFSINRGSSYEIYLAKNTSDLTSGNYFIMNLYSTSNFNANVYKIKIETSTTTPQRPNGVSYANFLNIYYYDFNDEYIQFSFFVSKNYAFETRTYYLSNAFENLDGYDAGYQEGYLQGVQNGENIGYENGYNVGQSVGYENGYSAGVVAGGDYTFSGLLGAVIDVPVSAFTSLLNFNILGVNILGFITGLLTLALIIFIIKLCLGGK